jgi:hypothetical protein
VLQYIILLDLAKLSLQSLVGITLYPVSAQLRTSYHVECQYSDLDRSRSYSPIPRHARWRYINSSNE